MPNHRQVMKKRGVIVAFWLGIEIFSFLQLHLHLSNDSEESE